MNSETPASPRADDGQRIVRSLGARILSPITEVRSGEALTAVLLMAAVFLLLSAYYLVKPVREGWLAISSVKSLSKIEVRALSAFGQSLVLLAVVPLYGRIAHLLRRRVLVTALYLFCMANLALFWMLHPGAGRPDVAYIGLAFYLWVGIFSVLTVMHFWAYAADVYDDATGRRLFPLIAVGASAGAVAGAWLSGWLPEWLTARGGDTFDMLLVALLPLLATIVLMWLAELRGPLGSGPTPEEPGRATPTTDAGAARPAHGPGALRLILSHRYLWGAALVMLLAAWVASNGDNVLYGVVQESVAADAVTHGVAVGAELDSFVRTQTTAFYGRLYFWVNVFGLLLQGLFASRLLRYGGFGAVLMLLPVVATVAYGTMSLMPLLGVIMAMKVAENSVKYSINNTAMHVLWLPTTRPIKYRVKAAVDTFVVRTGDGLAALTVLVAIRFMGWDSLSLFVLNIVLALAWCAVAWMVVRENRRWTAAGGIPE